MEIREVKSKTDRKSFCQVYSRIYRHDNSSVRPLDSEIETTFDSRSNDFFGHGAAKRWIALADGEVVGRIAAFINYEKLHKSCLPTGGIGFFECVEDRKIAFALFRTAVDWLKDKDMKAIDAPINFGENNNHWGLLVEGFTPPAYGMSYNPPYYKQFFEDFGFKPLYEQYTNHFDINKPLPERFRKIVERVCSKNSYHFDHLHLSNLDKYIDDFVEIYNKAWSHHENFSEISRKYVEQTFREMKPVMVPEMIWFAYVGDEPAGFIVAVPDANQIIKHFNGKMNLWSKIRFLWYRHQKIIDRVRVVIMGIVPEHQKKGLESGLIVKSFDAVKAMNQYNEAELSWVGSFNESMIAIHKASGATFGKKHITYRKIFSE